MIPVSQNFDFLATHDAQLARIGALAERYFSDDPIVTLVKLRLFGELLAQMTAARSGLFSDAREPQADILRRLRNDGGYPREVLELFHQIRIAGNTAVHEHQGDHAAALGCLKVARQLGIWFHRTFGDRTFKIGPFQPPRTPTDAAADLVAELERLRREREAALTDAERAQAAAAEAEAARVTAEIGAKTAIEERALWEQLAADAEAGKNRIAAELSALQSAAAGSPRAKLQQVFELAQEAAAAIDLDEADTRALIDRQLRDRGWLADSKSSRYSKGARPTKGTSMAIAEWPTANGPADYALFVGTTCVALVEAKRKRKNVQAAIDQTSRYSQGFNGVGVELPEGGPWPAQSGNDQIPPYRVPFL